MAHRRALESDSSSDRDLQREGGNAAFATVVQRKRSGPVLKDAKGVPIKGPDVVEHLRKHVPGLLSALTSKQLEQWQRTVDYYAVKHELRVRGSRLLYAYASRYSGRHAAAFAEQTPAYQQARKELDRYKLPPHTKADDTLTIDGKLLLSDDLKAPPIFDRDAENAWRKFVLEREIGKPIKLEIGKRDIDPHVLNRHVYNKKGVITLEALKKGHARSYKELVRDRPEVVKLRKDMVEIKDVMDHWIHENKSLSKMNKQQNIVRHIAELLGEGSQKYPSVLGWTEPKKQLLMGIKLMSAEPMQTEVAVPLIARAAEEIVARANKVAKYKHRVLTGAGGAVKWLERTKMVGSIAAGLASGGTFGVVGGALAGGGYTLAQEGAQQISAVGHGLQSGVDVKKLATDAGVATVLGLIGGPLSQRFSLAMRARLGLADDVFTKVWTESVSGGLASVYTTGAEVTLRQIADGKAMVKSADEFADLLVKNALQDAAMEVITYAPKARIEVIKAARQSGQPIPPLFSKGAQDMTPAQLGLGADGPKVDVDPDAAAGSKIRAAAMRRLVGEAGSWKRLRAELATGEGLGRGLTAEQRSGLIQRFESQRQSIGREAARLFDGRLAVDETPNGTEVSVEFTGPHAAQHAEQATAYLDARRPGWKKQTSIELVAQSRTPNADALRANLRQHMSPEARQIAADLVPVFDSWGSLDVAGRADMMLAAVNSRLAAFGVPKLKVTVGGKRGGHLDPHTWELRVSAEVLQKGNVTPDEFARVADTFAHEARHALQIFRALRLNPAAGREKRYSPEAIRAAEEANAGKRTSERLAPGTPEHQHAVAMALAFFGPASANRKRVYAELKVIDEYIKRAEADWERVKGHPDGDPRKEQVREDYLAALRRLDGLHVQYLNLPEEVDAWKHGSATGEATKQLLQLRASYETARSSERLQRRALVNAIDRASELRGEIKGKPHMHLSLDARPVRELDAWKKSLKKVERAEAKLVRAMTGHNP